MAAVSLTVRADQRRTGGGPTWSNLCSNFVSALLRASNSSSSFVAGSADSITRSMSISFSCNCSLLIAMADLPQVELATVVIRKPNSLPCPLLSRLHRPGREYVPILSREQPLAATRAFRVTAGRHAVLRSCDRRADELASALLRDLLKLGRQPKLFPLPE